jgi:type I restriction enzyme S subunit
MTPDEPLRGFTKNLPLDWQIVPFEQMLNEPVRNGVYKAKEFHGSGAKVVNMGELFGYDFLSEQEMKRVHLTKDEEIKFGLMDGDLLFARRSLVLEGAGKCSLVVMPRETTTFESSIIRARPNRKLVESRFLFYLFKSPLGRAIIASIATRTAVSGIRGSDLAKIGLPLPPLALQRRIADILSAYDELIENSQRRIKILESMARALYREWFVHFHYPENESVPLVDSPLGQIPKGWRVELVKDVLKRIPSGKKYDQKTASPTGTVPIFDQGKSGIIGYHHDEPGVNATESHPVIVFANHTCYQRLTHYPFSAIQNVLPFVSNPLLPRNIYWLHWATNGLIAFNDYKGHWPEFTAKRLVVPSVEICQRFGDFAAPAMRQILKLERAIENLRRTRDLLLPRLLSGQIDVTLSEP